MISKKQQEKFISLTKCKLEKKEQEWISDKSEIISKSENKNKFGVFFSLAPRFINDESIGWNNKEIEELNNIYPGFGKSQWHKIDIARAILMITLDTSVNKKVLLDFFEIAEMKEQSSLYKGLYLLTNAGDFKHQVTEGIRTNMVNVFDAIAQGNPFAKAYLSEGAWNQLILKSLFLERKLYTIQDIDKGKNKNLANMMQDYVKERWSAGRKVSLEIWRMIDGYLRDDVKALISNQEFKGIEKEIIEKLLNKDNSFSSEYWNYIGEIN
ncbi:hypothetical protein MHTCC0001_02250 [Flavobacteriaceae bacterium MHTCC 0001]